MINPDFDDLDALQVIDVALEAYADIYAMRDVALLPGALLLVSRIVALVRPVLDPDKLTPETQRTLDRLEGLAGPLMAAPVAH